MSLFKRPATHYGKSSEPETPYQRASQVWDERIGSARVQAKNWRWMAFGSLILSAGFASVLVWQSARGTIVPWVVQIDRLGQAQAVAPATADYQPTDPQMAWHLARFIEQVRSIPADAIIVRQNWLRAYEFTTSAGAMALNDYPRPHQDRLPIWLGVGGTPESFARAGTLGLPLMVAVIGGSFAHFRPLVDLYRRAWQVAGHPLGEERVGLHAMGFVGDTDEAAKDGFFPGWFQMFTQASKERGRPPVSRAQFETLCGPQGAFLIGSPKTVAAKMLAASETLGGLSRITFQMSPAALDTEAMQHSIELLGTAVAPLVKGTPPLETGPTHG